MKKKINRKVLKNLKDANKLKQEKTKDMINNKERYNINYIGIIIIVVVILSLIYLFFKYSSLFGINILKINNDKINITKDLNQEIKYYSYMNKLLEVSKNCVNLYDQKGNIDWTYNLEESFIPNVFIEDNYMVLSNNSLGRIYLFNGKKEVLNKSINEEISRIFLDNNGNMIIEYSNYGYKKKLNVFNNKGNLKYSFNVDNEAILDIKMLNNANKLVIIQAISKSVNIGTKISYIDINNSNSINELISIENKLTFKNILVDNKLNLISENEIFNINIDDGEINNVKYFNDTNVTDIYLNYNYYSSIEKNDDSYMFVTSKYDGTIISNTKINNLPKYIKGKGLVTYVVFEDNIMVLNKWGIILDKFSITIPPNDIIIYNDSKTVALIYTNRIEIFNI